MRPGLRYGFQPALHRVTVSQKQDVKLLPTTSTNVNRFQKFFR